ncbi:MAG: hypothetical protein QM811_08945 [Pirellulales bacterium]
MISQPRYESTPQGLFQPQHSPPFTQPLGISDTAPRYGALPYSAEQPPASEPLSHSPSLGAMTTSSGATSNLNPRTWQLQGGALNGSRLPYSSAPGVSPYGTTPYGTGGNATTPYGTTPYSNGSNGIAPTQPTTSPYSMYQAHSRQPAWALNNVPARNGQPLNANGYNSVSQPRTYPVDWNGSQAYPWQQPEPQQLDFRGLDRFPSLSN